jgi:hypothetical protein
MKQDPDYEFRFRNRQLQRRVNECRIAMDHVEIWNQTQTEGMWVVIGKRAHFSIPTLNCPCVIRHDACDVLIAAGLEQFCGKLDLQRVAIGGHSFGTMHEMFFSEILMLSLEYSVISASDFTC